MADSTAGIAPNTPTQGSTGTLTITLPGCVEINTGQPSTPDPSGGMGSGAIVAFAGTTEPEGWLLCDGAAISRTRYENLFNAIGEIYGAGDSSTTFNLPDLRGRFPLGLDDMGGTSADVVTAAEADALNGSGGAETHTLTKDEMPAHSHGVKHAYDDTNGGIGILAAYHVGSQSVNTSGENEVFLVNTGGGAAHNNMPPFLSLNYIIKT